MINNLTGLRFYLALWVVLYHVKEALNIPVLSEIVNLGYLGVDVFFILSGYILTHVYYDVFFVKAAGWADTFDFIKRRFARIYPLHLVTLIGAVVFMLLLNTFLSDKNTLYWDHILPQFFMVHAWGVVDGIRWNFPSWSVSSEWFAYLFVFPTAYFLFRKGGIRLLLFATLAIFLIYMIMTYFFFSNDIGLQLDKGFVRIIPEFLLGSTIYVWFWKSRTELPDLLVGGVYATMAAVAVVIFNNWLYVFIMAVPFLLVAIHRGNRAFNTLFGSRVIVFLGELSYSIYMLHFFSRAINGIIQNNFFGVEINSPVYFVNYLLLTIGFSVIGYFVVEVPCRKYISNLKLINSEYPSADRARPS